MNKIAYEQLKSCKVAEVGNIDLSTTHVLINRSRGVQSKDLFSESQDDFGLGDKYLIKVEKYIINPPKHFTLADNWNNGTVPPSEYMVVEVIQIVGKMIKVSAVAYDYIQNKILDKAWVGWLPKKSMSILQKLL